ncbi:MAG: RpiB/LacA/LacB family sugar-phosphate isomerase [Anaerolineaceae bacterium]|jgi:ribose 5-phosphate isomerase B|nr:RpiB/LacA/LacB family sugar-phosphate isomerase [Anaerolineaceae bacterium]
MKIVVACDHGGFPLHEAVLEAIEEAGHEAIDLGISEYKQVDFPDFAEKAAKVLIAGQANRAVLMCGSGIGISMAANKIKGIFAGLCHDTYSAHQGVEHDEMNALCMGGLVIGTELAKDIVKAFLNAVPDGVESHVRRMEKVRKLEDQLD